MKTGRSLEGGGFEQFGKLLLHELRQIPACLVLWERSLGSWAVLQKHARVDHSLAKIQESLGHSKLGMQTIG
jgi:hypothetical protein